MSRRAVVRLGAAVLAAGAVVVATPAAASAHPLGNFTVNRYSGVVVGTDAVAVDHVLDVAEIPTAQRTPRIDSDHDGSLSRGELSAWASGACGEAASSLRLTVGGTPVTLAVRSATARTLQGQAGLPTLRLECGLRAPVRVTGRTSVRLVDSAADDEVGWREMTARGDGTTLARSDVPTRSRSALLTAYPKDLLSSPLDVRSLRLTVTPGGPRLAADRADHVGSQARGNDRLTLAFEGLLQRTDGNPWLGALALLAAVLLGAAHAVAPGHGKTIMAFYLSGRREGSMRAAATVGATVTATHTAGVLLLGLLVSAGTSFVPARVYPWLGVASGVLVLGVGLTLLRETARRRTQVHADGSHSHGLLGRPHTHGVVPAAVAPELVAVGADGGAVPARRTAVAVPHEPHEHPHPHPHAHDHEHGHGHDHSHPAAVVEAPPARRQLVAMGLAGGLVPSPSALLVLLGAVALGHAWFGVLLVVAFGLGMAATLAGVGLLVLRLRGRAEARLARDPRARLAPLLRWAPTLTAVVVVVLGTALALRGLSGTGVV